MTDDDKDAIPHVVVAEPSQEAVYDYDAGGTPSVTFANGDMGTTSTVEGATFWEACNQLTGQHAGHTDLEISEDDWDEQVDRTEGQLDCGAWVTYDITNVTVQALTTVNLPKWDGYENAAQAEKSLWDSYISRWMAHEQKHVTIVKQEVMRYANLRMGLTVTAVAGTVVRADELAQERAAQVGQELREEFESRLEDRNEELDNEEGLIPCLDDEE